MTHAQLQAVPVGKGFLLLYGDHLLPEFRELFPKLWEDRFPEAPVMLMEYAHLERLGEDQTPMFVFEGDISPEALDEFRAWWEARNPREEEEPTPGRVHAQRVADAVGHGYSPRSVMTDDPTGEKRELLCTFHHKGEPPCGRFEDDPIHPGPDERMPHGGHVFRHEAQS